MTPANDPYPTTLPGWLERCYAAEHLNHGTLGNVVQAMRSWLADGDNGKARTSEAASKLAALTPDIVKRDFISLKSKTYLEAALAPGNA